MKTYVSQTCEWGLGSLTDVEALCCEWWVLVGDIRGQVCKLFRGWIYVKGVGRMFMCVRSGL